MKIEKVFEKLLKNKIEFVLIGGTALIGYGSTRVTFDTDIAVKTIDLDKIIELLYDINLKLVIGVDEKQYPVIAKNLTDALNFIKTSKWGFLKFLSNDLELDIIYEISVPFMELYTKSTEIKIEHIKINLASLDHLKIMKKKSIKTRNDKEKTKIDRIDLDFINKKLRVS